MTKVDYNPADRRQASPEALAQSAAQAVAHLDHTVRRLNRTLSSVHETSRLLTAPMDLPQVLEIVVRTVAEAIGADAAGLRLLDADTGQLTLKATYNLSPDYINKGPVTAGESTLNLRALAGEAIVVEDMPSDPHFQRYHADIVREGLVSNLTIGLMYRDQGIGILRLYHRRKRSYSEADVRLAQIVAAQSAAAIVNARLYADALEGERVARQVRLAGDVQRHLVPRTAPNVPGLDIAGRYVPCYDVGGDFYDYITLPGGCLILAIGDVMGKGVPASLAMASLRSSLRACAEMIETLDEFLPRVNRMFCRDVSAGDFATLFVARYNPGDSSLIYCNCGHEPPILLRASQVYDLTEGGAVLGIDPAAAYRSSRLTLQAGDLLLLYTDGLPDAVDFAREPFGRQRVIEAAQVSAHLNADQAARNILWLMRKFTGLAARFDDTALVVIKKTS